MRWRSVAVGTVAVLLWASLGHAHRLSGMQVGRYLRLDVENTRISGRYNINFENVPAFGERKWMDRDEDGQISEEEGISYADSLLPELQDSAKFELDGRRLKVTLTNGRVELGKKTIIPEPFQVIFDIELAPVELKGIHRLDFWDTIYVDDAPPKVLVQVRGDRQMLKQWHGEKRMFWDRSGTSAVVNAPFSLVIGPEASRDRIPSALLKAPRFGAAGDADTASGPPLPLIVLALAIAGLLVGIGIWMLTGGLRSSSRALPWIIGAALTILGFVVALWALMAGGILVVNL